MHRKLITLVAGLAIAGGLGGNAAAAPQQNCPQLRAACQPIGDRPDTKRPKPLPKVSRPLVAPKLDSSGQQWRAGNHIMY